MKTKASCRYKVFQWNIEGFKRNQFALKHFIELEGVPDFIFLSEPQIFQCDLSNVVQYFSGQYFFSLNSSDCFDPELPLVRSSAIGGTLAMWKRELDPFITVLKCPSPSILPIVFNHPDFIISVHITVYLPTRGQETEFIDALAHLANTIHEIKDKNPEAMIFVRGDANVNPRNLTRAPLLDHFCNENVLHFTNLNHSTYHHFLGNGASDSQLDVVLCSHESSEEVQRIHCKLENPLLDSHHDLIVSSFNPLLSTKPPIDKSANVTAPRVPNNREKILWCDKGIDDFQNLVSPSLVELRSRWNNPTSPSSVSVLLQTTNSILSSSASLTNKSVKLDKPSIVKSKPIPGPLRITYKAMNTANKIFRKISHNQESTLEQIEAARATLKDRRKDHRKLVRYFRAKDNLKRDELLYSILTSNPSEIYKKLRQAKSNVSSEIQALHVGDKLYTAPNIVDGFYDSIASLKTQDISSFLDSPTSQLLVQDYTNIIELCASGPKIPPISMEKSTQILLNLKPSVNDFYSITANHYKNCGLEGFRHFNFLLNTLVSEINLISLPELNSVYAHILYKGHKKEKSSERSYRTISTCPLLAKSLDSYIRELNIENWKSAQAKTQFQGEGSSHDLAGLLLTESIQNSIHSETVPLYVLYLDARSAFDRVVRQLLVRNLFHSGTTGHQLLFINERLSNRLTYCEWDKTIVGPINDTLGVEQGGVNSDNYYKLTNNEQLSTAQATELGVTIKGLTISAIGLADDVALVTQDFNNLENLLYLTLSYCAKYNVDLVPDKTKLQVFIPKSASVLHSYFTSRSLSIASQKINFVDEAEHVGVIRSVHGNLPHLLNRVSAFKNAMATILPTGIARRQRGNPAASLKVLQLNGTPKLLSGVATLVLSKPEIQVIESTIKDYLQNLQKLYVKTPRPVICFLSGTLPGTASLHLRQLSLFGMVCRLSGSILWKLAKSILTCSKPSTKSWFLQIKDLCLQYSLPHPLSLLDNPPPKEPYKKMVKTRVTEYWEFQLHYEASKLDSLKYLNTSHLSLQFPHPLWTSCAANPFEVSKAVIQARMLSGRYRSDHLARHWTSNRMGYCQLPQCIGKNMPGTLEHILVSCPSLSVCRQKMSALWSTLCQENPTCAIILSTVASKKSEEIFTQFLLDCSTMTCVMEAVNSFGTDVLVPLFHLTRTWCFTIHRTRMNLLGLWGYK